MIYAETMADELCKIMESIVGVADVKSKVRAYPYPMLRAMIWTQMTNEGYPFSSCGRAFGMDHATVIYMVKKWREIARERTACWRDYLSVWDAFQKRVEEEPNLDRYDPGERLTVAMLKMQMERIPPDATVVLEAGHRHVLKYDNELNTLFIRG